jgi:hypothetical protein
MKFYRAVQKLLVGDRQTRQTGGLISLVPIFESRLKSLKFELGHPNTFW